LAGQPRIGHTLSLIGGSSDSRSDLTSESHPFYQFTNEELNNYKFFHEKIKKRILRALEK